MWGIASVLWRDSISTVGDSISNVEAIQYCGGTASVHEGGCISTVGIASVLRSLFSTAELSF